MQSLAPPPTLPPAPRPQDLPAHADPDDDRAEGTEYLRDERAHPALPVVIVRSAIAEDARDFEHEKEHD